MDARGLDGLRLVVWPPRSPLSGRRQHPCSPKASVRQHTSLATIAELSSNHRWRWLDIKTHFLPFVFGCSLSLSGPQGQRIVQSQPINERLLADLPTSSHPSIILSWFQQLSITLFRRLSSDILMGAQRISSVASAELLEEIGVCSNRVRVVEWCTCQHPTAATAARLRQRNLIRTLQHAASSKARLEPMIIDTLWLVLARC